VNWTPFVILLLARRQFRVTTFDEQAGLDPAPFADLFGESDDLFDVSTATYPDSKLIRWRRLWMLSMRLAQSVASSTLHPDMVKRLAGMQPLSAQ
jgi:hypothetical protein